MSPGDRKFAKRNSGANDTSISRFTEEKRRTQREEVASYLESGNEEAKVGKRPHGYRYHFAVGSNKGSKGALENGVFVGVNGKRGISARYEDNVGRKKADRNLINTLKVGFNASEKFVLSRGKKTMFNDKLEDSDGKDTSGFSGGWRDSFSRYHRRPKREAKGFNQDNAKSTDKLDLKRTKIPSNYREKRNTYETELREDALLKRIEESVAAHKPRGKLGNVAKLQEDLDSYFIGTKGKKASGFMDNSERQDEMSDAMPYSIARDLLKILLIERPKCNEEYCDDAETTEPLKSSRPVLRSRRESIAKLLKYDPFVIIRGKRVKLENF